MTEDERLDEQLQGTFPASDPLPGPAAVPSEQIHGGARASRERRGMVMVGAMLAGAKAAEALRERGYDGPVTLVGEERVRPYERPPLSKEFLRGELEDDAPFVHEASFYRDNEIELVLGVRAERLDLSAREVALADGRTLPFERVLLATGAEPRRLDVPGSELDGVRVLRTVEDSNGLREAIRASSAGVVVIGGGWIGCEAAASARTLGAEVTIVHRDEVLLEHVLGREGGAIFHELHREHGVRLVRGDVAEIEGSGRVAGVRTAGGERIAADLVLAGIGVTPRTALAGAAGLAVENGIAVSETLESSAPGVHAAGDVANAWHPLFQRRVRVEHWGTALEQGAAAGRAMLGDSTPYDRVPYFFSDQFDLGMEYAGLVDEPDEVVIRGDAGARECIVFWLRGGRVQAGMNVNVWDVNDDIQRLVRAGEAVAREALTDPSRPLSEVAPGAG